MAYIAELQIKVDTTQLDQAKRGLDDLAKISPKVESSTDGIASSLKNVSTEAENFTNAQSRLIARVREQVDTFGKAREDVLSYRAGLIGVSSVVNPLVSQLKDLKQESLAATAAQKEQDTVNKSIVKSQEQLSTAQYRLIESLREEIALFGKSKEEILVYRAGLLGISDQVNPLVEQLQRLKAAKEEEARAGKESGDTRLSKREQEKQALSDEARELENLIRLEKERVRAEVEASGGGPDTTRTREASAALERYGSQLDEVNRKQKQADQSADALGDEYTQLKYSIDPVAKSLDDIAIRQGRLKELYKSGQLRIPQQEYQNLNTILEDSRKRINDLGSTTGKTAKEINFALRGLPAQFTDIAVSLQGGQAPLTVFLQQGGQIKDMFGGVGPALKAMGGYILSLISPLTVATAALGAFAVAAYQGGRESTLFNQALILTGNYAGVTSEQLSSLSAEIAKSTGTQRAAAAALTEVASRGKFTADQIELVGRAAVAMSSATGKAVSDTVDEFEQLAKNPSEAILSLNSKYHFLTASVYEQIRALEEQGETQAAAQLAIENYSDVLETRSSKITENLGYVEKAWKSITGVAKSAWDAMLNVGREATFEEQIEDATEAIAQAQRELEVSYSTRNSAVRQKAVADAKAALQALKDSQNAKKEEAKVEGERQQAQTAAAEAYKRINAIQDSNISQSERYRKQLTKLAADYELVKKAGDVSAASEKAYGEAVAATQVKLDQALKTEAGRNKPATVRENEAQRLLTSLRQQEASLLTQLESTSKIGREQRELAKLQQEFLDIENKKKTEALTKDQQALLSNKEAILAQQQKNVSIENEIRSKQELVKLDTIRVGLEQQIANDRQKYQDSLIGATVSDKEADRLRERNRLNQDYQKQLEALGKQNREGSLSNEGYEAATDELRSALDKRKALLEQYYADTDEQQGNWLNGSKKAFANYLEAGSNTAALTNTFFTNAFSSMEDAIVNFVTTGKLSFKDFAKSILSDLARIATRVATNQILMSILGSFAGGISTTATSAAGSISTNAATINNGSSFAGYAANGKAFNSSGVEFFANGGTFTNSIVNKPTAFGTGSGVGIMGEAGPEAILPLTRTSDGQLGVKSLGGGSTVVAPVSVTMSVNSGVGSGDGTSAESQGRSVQQAIKSECEKAISNGLKPGGSIWRSINQR